MKWTGLSPYEVLYGPSYSLIKGIREDLKKTGDITLRQQIHVLGLTLSKINDCFQERLPVSLTTHMHPYRPGDAIWVKE
jgi:hypothetical protein